MKRLATLQSVYSLHQQALGGKAYSQYTDDEIKLHVQSLTIANCIADYARLEVRLADVEQFISTYDKKPGPGMYEKIIADTWRWILDLKPQLPIVVARQR